MSKEEIAQNIFKNGFNCAQAVLTTYCSKYNLDENIAKKLSCGFGAGCARRSLTCGAVSGAYMVIGLKYGKVKQEDEGARDLTYKKINDFSDYFISINNSINCKELLGIDLATTEGQTFFNENDLLNQKCTNYVKDACIILDKMEL
jgi:C_GCAxxG_C_C family probable redox protein